MTVPILAITSDEPAGIGPDICLDLAFADLPCRPVVLWIKPVGAKGRTALANCYPARFFKPKRPIRCPAANSEVLHIPLAAECRAANLILPMPRILLRLLDTAYQGISDGLFAW